MGDHWDNLKVGDRIALKTQNRLPVYQVLEISNTMDNTSRFITCIVIGCDVYRDLFDIVYYDTEALKATADTLYHHQVYDEETDAYKEVC